MGILLSGRLGQIKLFPIHAISFDAALCRKTMRQAANLDTDHGGNYLSPRGRLLIPNVFGRITLLLESQSDFGEGPKCLKIRSVGYIF